MKWLERVLAELKEIKPEVLALGGPKDKIDPKKEHLVGKISEDTQRIYALARQYKQTALEHLKNAKRFLRKDDPELMDKASECYSRSQALMAIFWITIKDELNLWDKPSIGIRNGWDVVWMEKPQNPLSGMPSGMMIVEISHG